MKLGYKLFIGGIIVATASVFLSGCGIVKTSQSTQKVDLEVWGLFDDSDTFDEAISEFKNIDTGVAKITYKKLDQATYQNEIIQSLAAGNGPDIILIQNSWLVKFANKISPAPVSVIDEKSFRSQFVDVVANDFDVQGKIYAVPLSVDNLALYYNKDIFNQAGIVAPPKTWSEFVDDVKKTTKIDSLGQIKQAGAAMGTAYNINRSTDVLNLLFLQNKTQMLDPTESQAMFQSSAGNTALEFYTNFAKSGSSFYTWNPKMHYSLDAFSEGTLAMMINYSWQIQALQSKAPKLNYGIAPVPQVNGDESMTYSNYWAFAVVANKPNITDNGVKVAVSNDFRVQEAWKFLKFLTMNNSTATSQTSTTYDAAAKYIDKTHKPAGRRDLIEKQKNDASIGVFATQNLVAKSWRQPDPDGVDNTFATMINKVNIGAATISDAIRDASLQITQLISSAVKQNKS